jgi:hypothetical protein
MQNDIVVSRRSHRRQRPHMNSSRKGVQLRLADIPKDVDGFDDLEEFWNASGKSLTAHV